MSALSEPIDPRVLAVAPGALTRLGLLANDWLLARDGGGLGDCAMFDTDATLPREAGDGCPSIVGPTAIGLDTRTAGIDAGPAGAGAGIVFGCALNSGAEGVGATGVIQVFARGIVRAGTAGIEGSLGIPSAICGVRSAR
ncbi:MAG: hypothetical protein HOW73_39475 [Polyangiaceae bacterium]|nr:hypothetical protein [Polyangiaceae bacterium]